MYYIDHGTYPVDNPNPGYETSQSRVWETSVDPGFLSVLDEYTGNARFTAPGKNLALSNEYAYNFYAAGTFGCDASLGSYVVLRITGMETQDANTNKVGQCTGNTQTGDKVDYAEWFFNG